MNENHCFWCSPLGKCFVFDFSAHSLDVAPGGIDAIVRLTRGDMRRALNIFQVSSVSSAFSPFRVKYNMTSSSRWLRALDA